MTDILEYPHVCPLRRLEARHLSQIKQSLSPYTFSIEQSEINFNRIGGYIVPLMAEPHRNPLDKPPHLVMNSRRYYQIPEKAFKGFNYLLRPTHNFTDHCLLLPYLFPVFHRRALLRNEQNGSI